MHLRGWCFDGRSPIERIEAVFPEPLSAVPLTGFGMPSPDVAASVAPEAAHNRFDGWIDVPAASAGRDFRLRFTLRDGTVVLGESAFENVRRGDPLSGPPGAPGDKPGAVGTDAGPGDADPGLGSPARREAESRSKRVEEFLDRGDRMVREPAPPGEPAAAVQGPDGLSFHGGRSAYKQVWNGHTRNLDVAALAVAGFTDEADMEITARVTIDTLRFTVGLRPDDLVLEIGCGIARVGKPLSRECLHWFGADISGGMLGHAAARLRGCPNTTLVELSAVGLQEFPPDAFDLVYCTIVFMHLLEWDRYRYVEEAFRILRPGGRCYFDNFQLDSRTGWKIFTDGALYPPDERPAHISMASTREELGIYLRKAGFGEVRVYELPGELIAATGRKPG